MTVKTIRTGSVGKVKLRLVRTDKGFVAQAHENGSILHQVDGQEADAVWAELQTKLTQGGPNWFGYEGARSRFLHWFARGFHSPAYLKDERDYKLAAKARLEKTAPVAVSSNVRVPPIADISPSSKAEPVLSDGEGRLSDVFSGYPMSPVSA